MLGGMRRVTRKLFVLTFVTTAVAAFAAPRAGSANPPSDSRATSSPASVVIGVAGDIACASDPYLQSSHDSCQYDDTSNLVVHQGLT